MEIVKKTLAILMILSLALVFGCAKKEEPPAETEEAATEEAEVLAAQELTPKEELGRRLFFDTRLSEPEGQACAACHGPTVGWTGPDEDLNKAGSVYPGALEPRFGNRKPPASSYAGFSPKLHRDEEGTFVGGMFWDGRATGWTLGDPLAEQAMGPFLNPLEQNMPDNKAIVQKVMDSDYAGLFREVWGADSLNIENPDATYEKIARSIAAYERSGDVTKFTSKFDDFWRKATKAGLDVASIDENSMDRFQNLGLSEAELKGFVLFNQTGLCSQCHVLDSEDGYPPLFTDYTYDNLGIPRNPENPFYKIDKQWNPDGGKWLDKGLGGFLETTEEYKQYAQENMGKQKVPTLRNVDLRPFDGFVKAFTHNGYFKTLKELVNFYNIRDKEGANWPPPEIAENVNVDEMGNLGLTPEEEDLIVLFMKTLSDR
jgi:cytochrome c peroxidase